MKSWRYSIQKADAKQLYRAERLTLSKNPDWISKHGDEAKSIAKKDLTLTKIRIHKDTEKRIQNHTPSNSIRPIRLNRGLPK